MSSLYQTIQNHIADFENRLYTTIPAIVDSYQHEEGTVSVIPAINDIDVDGTIRIPSLLERIPIAFPNVADCAITFPIKKGDKVSLHFFQTNTDNFFTQAKGDGTEEGDAKTNSPVNPRTRRRHSINDCFVTLGLRFYSDTPVKLPDTLDLYYKNTRITFSEDGKLELEVKNPDTNVDSNIDILPTGEVAITNNKETSSVVLEADGNIKVVTKSKFSVENSSIELISLLSDLIDTLANTTVNTVYGASILNSKTQLTQLKTQLDTMKR